MFIILDDFDVFKVMPSCIPSSCSTMTQALYWQHDAEPAIIWHKPKQHSMSTFCSIVIAVVSFLLCSLLLKRKNRKHTVSKKLIVCLCTGLLAGFAWCTLFDDGYSTGAFLVFIIFMILLFWLAIESYHDLVDMHVRLISIIAGTTALAVTLSLLACMPLASDGLPITHAITIQPKVSLISGMVMALCSGLFVLVTRKKGLGTADIAFFIIMGLVNGYPGSLNALYISVFSATLYGGIVALQKKKILGVRIPFIPFISLGTLVAFLLGNSALIAHFL
jgi:prepilin signal peptidase PulO-like enzyme (type II secretory pathway)